MPTGGVPSGGGRSARRHGGYPQGWPLGLVVADPVGAAVLEHRVAVVSLSLYRTGRSMLSGPSYTDVIDQDSSGSACKRV